MNVLNKNFLGLRVGISSIAILAALSGCGGGSGSTPKSDVQLIVLKDGQTYQDVISSRSSSSAISSSVTSSSASSASSLDVVLTTEPATEGSSLFVRADDPSQNIAGFEFCCGKYDTYQKHGFTDATGDFLKLDGGFWGAGVEGHLGERVFSSYGDGAAEGDANVAQLGFSATGTLMSPEFDINTTYINFLVGGGSNRFDATNPTAIVLVVDGKVVRQSHGKNEENKIIWASWDVSELNGKKGKIKFIDGHPDDASDSAVPYILADEFRAANKAAAAPESDSKVTPLAPIAADPATAGASLFSRADDPSQNVSGFEFCCGKYDTYQKHGFTDATGDFLKLDGGFWGAGVEGHLGERVFSSYGDGAAEGDANVAQLGFSATGTVMSPEFDITTDYINFLVGGGSNRFDATNPTAIVLVVDGKVVRQSHGKNEENKIVWDSWDVSGLKGKKGKIKFIDGHPDDASDSAVPYILADEFRAANEAAVQPANDSVVGGGEVVGTSNLKLDMGDANPFYKDGEYYIYYLANKGFHSWELVKTTDLMTSTPSVVVLPASGDSSKVDKWLGSGSVMKDQNNNYHLFATGHNENLSPMESTLHATASDATLTHWSVQSNETFSGTGGYSTNDFRDPLVFWNQAAQKYWMVITTRYQSKAAIGLLSSTNLSSWSPEAPLYTEASPLNLEVADYFTLGQVPFMVYSDQRDASRQVKYLSNTSNSWVKPSYDALDGKAFYAARTAGTDDERLLFGWVTHKVGRVDTGNPEWGGDLMIHQVKKLASGELAVSLPQKLMTALSNAGSTDAVWSDAAVTGSVTNLNLNPNTRFTLAESNVKNRLSLTLNSQSADAVAGLQLRNPTTGKSAFVKIDSLNNKATFYFEGDESNPGNPSVSLPLDYSQGVKLDVYMDPIAGVAAVYINDFRALSFRLYDLAHYQVGLFATADVVSVADLKRYSK